MKKICKSFPGGKRILIKVRLSVLLCVKIGMVTMLSGCSSESINTKISHPIEYPATEKHQLLPKIEITPITLPTEKLHALNSTKRTMAVAISEETFSDLGKYSKVLFDILKVGVSRPDLEQQFHIQFKNLQKSVETGAYEEAIKVTICGNTFRPLIIGFDENDRLAYIRDVFHQTRITYIKPRAYP
jgi:hypothetical protein